MFYPAATSANNASSADVFPAQQPVELNWRQSFWALIVTQFQGAFSLNVLRYLLSFMVIGAALGRARTDSLVSLVAFLFFFPLVLFTMACVFLPDRSSDRQVMIAA